MKKALAISALALVLAGCSSWDYGATPTHEVHDNKPSTAVKQPPRCFTVAVDREHFFSSSSEPIGLYCRVADPESPQP